MMIKAGTGIRSFKVPPNTPLFGHPGFGRIAEATHDPLRVTAVHLRTGVHGALFIALDLYGLDPYQHQRILAAVAEATGVHRDRIFMGCSHTQAGPVSAWSYAWKDDTETPGPDSSFLETVAQASVAAAAEACATTRPVTLGLTEPVTAPNMAAGSLVLRQEDGALAALLTINSEPPAWVAPENTGVSAGTPFFFRERICEREGGDIPVVFFEPPTGGLARDLRPEPDPFADVRRAGHRLADATLEALKTTNWHALDDRAEFSFRKISVSLPLRAFPEPPASRPCDARAATGPMPEFSDSEARSVWQKAVTSQAHTQAIVRLMDHERCGRLDQMAMLYGTAEATVARIGPLTLIGLPGNPPPAVVAPLKRTLPGPVWVTAHINGFLQGDMVTIEQEQRGEFGAMPCPFSVTGMNSLVESILS